MSTTKMTTEPVEITINLGGLNNLNLIGRVLIDMDVESMMIYEDRLTITQIEILQPEGKLGILFRNTGEEFKRIPRPIKPYRP